MHLANISNKIQKNLRYFAKLDWRYKKVGWLVVCKKTPTPLEYVVFLELSRIKMPGDGAHSCASRYRGCSAVLGSLRCQGRAGEEPGPLPEGQGCARREAADVLIHSPIWTECELVFAQFRCVHHEDFIRFLRLLAEATSANIEHQHLVPRLV